MEASSSFQGGGQLVSGMTVTSAPVSNKKGILMVVPFRELWREQIPHTTGGLSHLTARATQGSRPHRAVPAVPGTEARFVGSLAGP